MTRSPTLKTLWIGSQPGVWKTSPRKPSGAPAAGAEFANSVASCGIPAAAIASGSAGMTPPLASDGGEVQRAAGRDHEQAGDVAVDDEEGAEQQVAGEVDLLTEAAGAAGQDRDDQDLDHERGHGEPRAAELEVGEAGQPSTRQRHREDAEQQGGADQHTRDIDAGPCAP